jgi:hypothetical protein
MRARRAAFVAAAVISVGLGSAVATADPQPAEPGTPGEPNCVGQTNAYIAQLGKAGGFPGIGNLARAEGASVKEVREVVTAYCAGEF